MIKTLKKERRLPSLDFIAGVIAIEGAFMWIKQNKKSIPVFQLKMRADEQKLFELIKSKLRLKEVVYQYNHQNRHYVLMLIRSRASITSVIIPLLDKRLYGTKKAKFEAWRDKMLSIDQK
ncbi:MAG: LAGLIDADG family homing endonuclease [Patescibacteria group bacterium]